MTDEGYVGIDVHRAARIMTAGHGGQVLVSQATRELLQGDLVDLGEHRLKDLLAPQRLWQLGPGTFPPPRSMHQTNLPVQATPLVGRERELAEAAFLLRRHRLVTFTGPGGSGKTRLALQLAAERVDDFADGVWWIPLAAIADPRLVLPAVAQALGTTGDVASFLKTKTALLLLDNLEQIIDCAPQIGELLAGAPALRILATSREPLRIDGEREHPVGPLEEEEAVSLFIERALDAEPRAAVREICRRLDCLPLAVELAAARTGVLPPTQLLARLTDRLGLLTGGRRDLPARQRTLRATIEWSHDLLTPPEQALFRDLGVFAGDFALEAAEAIAGADVDALQSLVERSLVRRSPGGRFALLETIREFARERLDADPRSVELAAAHARYYLALAETIAPKLTSSRQDEGLDDLELEHPNMRAALSWALRERRADVALRLCVALSKLWMYHGHLREGRRWLAEALDLAPTSGGSMPIDEFELVREKAVASAAVLATLQADWTIAERYASEQLTLARRGDDDTRIASALLALGRPALARGDPDSARRALDESLQRARAGGAAWLAAMATFNLAYVSLSVHEFDRARAEMADALALFRPLDDKYGVARSLTGLGAVAVHSDELDAAIAPLRETLPILEALRDREGLAWALELFGDALAVRDPDAAARLLRTAAALRDELGITLIDAEVEPHTRALSRIGLPPDGAELAGGSLDLHATIAVALERTADARSQAFAFPQRS